MTASDALEQLTVDEMDGRSPMDRWLGLEPRHHEGISEGEMSFHMNEEIFDRPSIYEEADVPCGSTPQAVGVDARMPTLMMPALAEAAGPLPVLMPQSQGNGNGRMCFVVVPMAGPTKGSTLPGVTAVPMQQPQMTRSNSGGSSVEGNGICTAAAYDPTWTSMGAAPWPVPVGSLGSKMAGNADPMSAGRSGQVGHLYNAQGMSGMGAGGMNGDVSKFQLGVANFERAQWRGAPGPDTSRTDSTSSHGSAHHLAAMQMEKGRGSPVSTSASRRRRRQRVASAARLHEAAAEEAAAEEAKPATRTKSNPSTRCSAMDAQCARWTEQLNADGPERQQAISELKGSVRRLTFEAAGCRVVQLALQVADHDDQGDLAGELHGCVRRAIASPHGNYVIQKVVCELPTALAAFVVDELVGVAAEASRHSYGCRIVSRLLEHAAMEAKVIALVDEVLQECVDLCHHNFGHHVIQSILEHGLPQQRTQIAMALHAELPQVARNRNAAYVAERALMYCSPSDQKALASVLLSHPQALLALAENQFGFLVVRAMLRLTGDSARATQQILNQARGRLRSNKYGSRLLDEMKAAARAYAAATAA
eukprot:TRINITY_DN6896_c0_g1_i1.p1 TRINITY_DN6896_c0_g1~~TRINITY_DN6896_c0_g1_i1.p1  ORF type:complete len:592 (-),score=119.56 TRINITY_DN6896_c0_g1_i1:391-2166(-)